MTSDVVETEEPARETLERLLADIRAARAPLDAARAPLDAAEARILERLNRPAELVPLKRAAFEMGLEEEAARKRAQRSDVAVRQDGRWHFPRWYVDEVRTRKMSR